MTDAEFMQNPESQCYIQGTSFSNPLPVGVPFKVRTGRDDVYSMHEIYDVQIAVNKALRGKDAWELIKTEGITRNSPKPGFDFVLACIRITYSRRGKGVGNATYKLVENQFTTFSCKTQTEYPLPEVVHQTKPELFNHLFQIGESREGWVLLEVPKDDKKPLLVFKRDSIMGGLTGRWGNIWLSLY